MNKYIFVSGLLCLSIFTLAGCGQQNWYTPLPPTHGITQTWQIQDMRSLTNTTSDFSLEFGISTKSKKVDYSYWLQDLNWQQESRRTLVKSFGQIIPMLFPTGDNLYYYQLSIPDAIALCDPQTFVGFGTRSNESIVVGTVFLEDNNTQYLLFETRNPMIWTSTQTNSTDQTVTFSWSKTD